MFPLLIKDGQILQYVILGALWNWLIGYNPAEVRNRQLRYAGYVSKHFVAPSRLSLINLLVRSSTPSFSPTTPWKRRSLHLRAIPTSIP